MATTSLRVGRLARWRFTISRGEPAKAPGPTGSRAQRTTVLPELRARAVLTLDLPSISV